MDRKTQEDDGRTIADMSAEWMPWNRGVWRRKRRAERTGQPQETKEEQRRRSRAAVRAQYLAMLPMLGCILAGFGLMYFLLRLWLGA